METKQYYVDRIEGKIAVLIGRERESGELQMPVAELPHGTREGDWLTARSKPSDAAPTVGSEQSDTFSDPDTLIFEHDAVATRQAKKDNQDLMDELS